MQRKKLKRHEPSSNKTTSSTLRPEHAEEVGLSMPYSTSCRVVRYHVQQGSSVPFGQLVASCRNENTEEIIELRSPADGTISQIYIPEDGHFDGAVDPVFRLVYCLHDVVLNGLCTVCGRKLDDEAVAANLSSDAPMRRRDTATVNVEGGVKLEVTRDEALSVREATVTRLFQNKRLSLVLDLDHTLLHCTDDIRALNIAQNAPESARFYSFNMDGKTLVLKLRPGLLSFLQTMKSQYFEMYVYTAGTRAYAEKICTIIDPDGTTFGKRIVSRDDTTELGQEKDLTRLFPVDDTMVLVVDDRDVWNGVANLLTCEPFVYFTGMHDVNNSGWKTLSGEDEEKSPANGGTEAEEGGLSSKKGQFAKEEDMDAGLARVESILKQVHGKFFFPREPVTLEQQLRGGGSDVKIILRDIKMTILRKVVVAFDPEITPSLRETEITPEKYLETLFSKARSCGATLVDQVDNKTTHLVACGETELAKYGKQRGVWVVHPGWLEKSEHFWQRLKEEPFSMFHVYGTQPKSQQRDQIGKESRKTAQTKVASTDSTTPKPKEGDEEDDLDDFAAQLQSEMFSN